ncbi:MAG: tyrosine--tRNA ligase [Gemmatimonadetes bacterium]|nr:tyrosine--tRNA ligase [Gemmatimonadota bacterium]MCY3613135.1 tyrosine--tRNA ligase [Gemmatimonadota bacterium]MYA44489.1 tyrosine--tRNA ligase [Gemmatimonadota bacterium]MYE92745.1 tyrosine--tRNA ligase [Gemmatimonadota bacterium]MYJ08695.1 tyrosine--tRNA ligase [Gemmatimonadota bacterium]
MIDELRRRGLLADATEHAAAALNAGQVTGYIGFDPTASSLHVGSLVPIMGLVHLQRAGHCPIALVGGGTGLIGDPSGKAQERLLLDRARAEENAEGIRKQLAAFLDFESRTNPARMANNLEWLDKLGFVDFLRDIGKHFSVNAMLRKESVRRRLEDEESGISFTEFSYQLLQSYDFWELNRRYGCTLQMGGSDQWGNITAGIDLVRRLGGPRCHGIVFPLLTASGGEKFGKTEEGTVWLDPERTSPYRFYQFWLNTEDADVIRQLRFFTLLDEPDIAALEHAVAEHPHRRDAQRRLAAEVTRTVHGADGLERAERASRVLFGGSLEGLGAADIEEIFADVPSTGLARSALAGDGIELAVLMADAAMAPSRSEARRLIKGGGVYLNGRRATDTTIRVGSEAPLHDRFLVVRVGKKRYFLVELG